MNNRRQTTREYYLFDTNVENMFINEYMPTAPGEYVKVYLFAGMYADLDKEMSNEMLARQLGMQEEDVLKAWNYWEKLHVVRKLPGKEGGKFDYHVEFLNLKEQFYGKENRSRSRGGEGDGLDGPLAGADGEYPEDEIRAMFSDIEKFAGKALSGTEVVEVLRWINELGVTPEVALCAFRYCYSKNKSSIRYIATVVREWNEKGLKDADGVDDYLADTDQRRYQYRRVFRALGFIGRAPTEEEMRRMDSWFDDMGYTIDKVLEACSKTSGISSPNINYVDSVLKNWKKEGGSGQTAAADGGNTALVKKYYEYLRSEAEAAVESRRAEVLAAVPEIGKIDDELSELSRQATKLILASGADAERRKKQLDEQVNRLLQERAVLMTDNGFPLNYMDVKYQCDICKDTGFTDTGEKCSCYEERAREAAVWDSREK